MNPKDVVPNDHVHDDDLQLFILGCLNADEVNRFEHHVFHCAECTDRLGTTARIVGRLLHLQRSRKASDRRSEPRFHTSDAGFLRSFSPLLPDRWPVQIIDVSKNGIGLLAPTHLSATALVQVQMGDTFALGEVRYSKQIGENQFQVGIRLQDVLGAKR